MLDTIAQQWAARSGSRLVDESYDLIGSGEVPATGHVESDLIFNGLNGATGKYLLTASSRDVSDLALHEEMDVSHLNDIKARLQASEAHLGITGRVEDITDLSQTGWGVIFAANADPAVKEALGELLKYRRNQASTKSENYYREFCEAQGYHSGESKKDFLRRRGAAPDGVVNPDQMPYYLLIVGSPESIPYAFQYQLDVQYAVGRIHFRTLDEYANYARSVVRAETVNPRPRHTAFFGVTNPDDRATMLSSTALVSPLINAITTWQQSQEPTTRWAVSTVLGSDATKAGLKRVLNTLSPALLFTASHGIGFPNGDARQLDHQGALVCQDWTGPEEWQQALPQDFYFAWDDVDDQAQLLGMMAFHFACFGIGTPRLDDYPQRGGALSSPSLLGASRASAIAPHAFVARLPQRLLGHPKGGALAVVGHVERALGSSFSWQWAGTQRSNIDVFESTLRRLMRGYPVGAAVEYFNERYAELCAGLSEEIRDISHVGKLPVNTELAGMWMASADARGFAVFGDPAVRLAVNRQYADWSVSHTKETFPSVGQGVSDAKKTSTSIPSPEGTVMIDPGDSPQSPESSQPSHDAAGTAGTQETSSRSISPAHVTGPNIRLDIDPGSGTITASASVLQAVNASDEMAFPLFGGAGPSSFDDLRTSLTTSLKGLVDRLSTALGDMVANVSTLEVATYVSNDGHAVDYDARTHTFVGDVNRRAMTAIKIDGDTVALVPQSDGKIDTDLWAIHAAMVKQAQDNRTEFIKAVTAAASALLGALKQV